MYHAELMNAVLKIGDSEYEPARLDRAGIMALADSGVLDRLGRVEVIDGVIVAMSPSWTPHSSALLRLGGFFMNALEGRFLVTGDQWVLFGDSDLRAPDVAVFEKSMRKRRPESADLLFAVEIAEGSLEYDLGDKARFYAAHGLTELWVVDLENRRLHIHREPGAEGYGDVAEQPWDRPATPLIAPDVEVVMANVIDV